MGARRTDGGQERAAPRPKNTNRPTVPDDGAAAFHGGWRRAPPMHLRDGARARWVQDYDAAMLRPAFTPRRKA